VIQALSGTGAASDFRVVCMVQELRKSPGDGGEHRLTSPGRLRSTWFAVLILLAGVSAAATVSSDETVPWLITARAARGLFSERQPARVVSPSPARQWAAEVPEHLWQYLVLHHSGTQRGSLESIHAEHLRRRDSAGNPWRGIGYHFVIGNGQGMPDGKVQPTFRWRDQLSGAHAGTSLMNQRGIGICLIGNFETASPTAAQLCSVEALVRELSGHFSIPADRILGHSSVRATKCPGRLFPIDRLRDLAM